MKKQNNTLEWLHSHKRTSSASPRERMRLLCSFIDFKGLCARALPCSEYGELYPHLRYIHVAGTNGKGSACTMLDAILQAAGYKTGKFTSPYIYDFCERMTVCGRLISLSELDKFALIVREAEKALLSAYGEAFAPVEFDLVTAIGLLFFAAEKCDAVIMECGLGGENDSTNIIDGTAVSVIMHIDLDHTELLGATRAAIAKEKAGIFKRGAKAVIYPEQDGEAMRVLQSESQGRGAEIIIPDLKSYSPLFDESERSEFLYRNEKYSLSLRGSYQQKNALCAIEAALACGLPVSEEAIRRGLANSYIPVRFELVGREPCVIYDGAHNADGMSALGKSLFKCFPKGDFEICIGMLRDKNPSGAILPLLSELKERVCRFYCVTPLSPRAMPAEELAGLLAGMGFFATVYSSKAEAEEAAIAEAKKKNPQSTVAVCGSLYLYT